MVEYEVIEALKKDFIAIKMDISKHQLPLALRADVPLSFFFTNKDGKSDKIDCRLLE